MWAGFNDMATTRPDLAMDFLRSRNGDLTPQDVVAGTGKRLWWECHRCGHEWAATGTRERTKVAAARSALERPSDVVTATIAHVSL